MKKKIAFLFSMILLVTVMMTGCAKQTTVEFTVEGIDVASIMIGSTENTANYSKQEDINGIEPAKYVITFKTDGDYSFVLIDKEHQRYPLTLKLHNGKVEAEKPDGIIVNVTIK